MNFQELIKAKRNSKGWTLDKAAGKLNISKSYLWDLERGNNVSPSFALVVRMQQVYGISHKATMDAFGLQNKRA